MKILVPGTPAKRVCFQRIRTLGLISKAGIGGCSARVERHLDWGNRVLTPFISMYCDEGVAHREAKRRVGEGKKYVRVYKINMRRSDERREYRNERN